MGKKTVAKKIEGLQKRSFKNKKDNVIEHVSLASPISKKLKAVKSPSKTLTMRQLSKYKDLLSAISNVSSDTEKLAIMNSMQDKEFQMLCGCINSIVYDKGPMKGKLSNDEFSSLKSLVEPYKKGLQKFSSQDLSVGVKKRMLGKSQKGGNAILAAVIGSLLPMAVHAVENYIWPEKK